jgi:hypothetical protein
LAQSQNPKKKAVVVKGMTESGQRVDQSTCGSSQKHVTGMFGSRADGKSIAPLVIFEVKFFLSCPTKQAKID